MERRRVLVYAPTRAKDIIGWMDDILTRHGCRGAVMRADAMALENREAWVANVERGSRENGRGLNGRCGVRRP